MASLVIQSLTLNFSVIISPGKDAEIGTTAFPNTQKILENKNIDELNSSSAVVDGLIAEKPG